MTSVSESLLPAVDSIGLNEQELASVYEAIGGIYASASSPGSVTRSELVRKIPAPHAVANAINHVIRYSHARRRSERSEGGGGGEGGRTAALRGPVTRVHFHSLAFHLIAEYRSGEEGGGGGDPFDSGATLHANWKRAGATAGAVRAAAKGSATATLQACDASGAAALGDDDLDLLAPLSFHVQGERPGTKQAVQATVEVPVAQWRDGVSTFYYAPVLVCQVPKQTVGLGDAISSSGIAYAL